LHLRIYIPTPLSNPQSGLGGYGGIVPLHPSLYLLENMRYKICRQQGALVMQNKLMQILRGAFKAVQFIAGALLVAFIIAEIFSIDIVNRPEAFLGILAIIAFMAYMLTKLHVNVDKKNRLRADGLCPECAGCGWEGSHSPSSKCKSCFGTGIFIRPYLDIHPSHLDRPYKENHELDKPSLDYRRAPRKIV
jgi:uncharacterized membrane protein